MWARAVTIGAPKMNLVLVSEKAKGSGLSLGKGGVKVILKLRTQPCQPGSGMMKETDR